MNILGVERGKLALLPYQPYWRFAFLEEAAVIRKILGNQVLAIEHIGSTAVPGMTSKPIIDMMVAIRRFGEAPRLISRLESLGYAWIGMHPETPDRLPLFKGTWLRRTHHLSLAEPGSRYWQSQLQFRDALRSDAASAREYASLKKQLLATPGITRRVYTDSKGPFVRKILNRRVLAPMPPSPNLGDVIKPQ